MTDQSTIKDEAESGLEYDSGLAERALGRLRRQIAGNGVAPMNLSLKACYGHILEFYGALHLKLQPEITETKATGRASSGEIVASGQAQAKLQEFMQGLAYDENLIQQAILGISGRPGKGFGLDGETIPLPIEKTLVEQHQCPQCRGAGRSACPQCGGSRQMVCYKCAGSGTMHCIMCRGARVTRAADGSEQPCYNCQGRGMAMCDVCRGARMIGCSSCGGNGSMPCQPCGATGMMSLVFRLKAKVVARFEMRDDRLPVAAKQLLARVGARRLAGGGEVQVSILEPEEARETRSGTSPDAGDFLYLPYRALLPYARAVFELAQKKGATTAPQTMNSEIIGYKSRIVGLPAFMDGLFAAPLAALAQAARGEGIAANKVKQAAKWRSVRETLALVVKGQQKAAAQKLMQTLPVGLTRECAVAIVRNADAALKKITRVPRYIALGGGLLGSLGLYAAWFASLRSDALNAMGIGTVRQAQDIWVQAAVDFALIPIGIALTLFAIRYTGHTVMQKSLGELGLEQRARAWPKAGTAGLYALAGCPAVYAVAVMLAPVAPLWLKAIIGS